MVRKMGLEQTCNGSEKSHRPMMYAGAFGIDEGDARFVDFERRGARDRHARKKMKERMSLEQWSKSPFQKYISSPQHKHFFVYSTIDYPFVKKKKCGAAWSTQFVTF